MTSVLVVLGEAAVREANALRRDRPAVLAKLGAVPVTVTLLLHGERLVQGTRQLVSFHRRDRADRVGGILYRTVGRYFAVSVLIAGLNGLALLVAGLALVLPLTPPGTGVVCLLASLAHPPSGPADKIKALMTPGSPAGTSARRRMSTNPSAPTAAPWPARDFRMERA